jgi:hypothetical protein
VFDCDRSRIRRCDGPRFPPARQFWAAGGYLTIGDISRAPPLAILERRSRDCRAIVALGMRDGFLACHAPLAQTLGCGLAVIGRTVSRTPRVSAGHDNLCAIISYEGDKSEATAAGAGH